MLTAQAGQPGILSGSVAHPFLSTRSALPSLNSLHHDANPSKWDNCFCINVALNTSGIRALFSRRGRWLGGLGGQHNVVTVSEYKHLGRAPNDLLQIHHCAHLKPVLPQEQMLKEVPGQAPSPEGQMPIPDRAKAEPAQLEHKNIRAEKIVAPVLEKGRDTLEIRLSAAEVQ